MGYGVKVKPVAMHFIHLLRKVFAAEAAPTLKVVEGLQLNNPYAAKHTRFSNPSVDATVAVDGMDAIVELTGMYLRRATEVSAHHPPQVLDDRTLGYK